MKFLPLVWSNLWRRKFRTIFTLLSIFVAFLLFGLLMTIRTAFTLGVEIAGVDRLVLIHKVSLIMPLPVSYQAAACRRSGRRRRHAHTWFGGIYQDPSNFFANMAVEPETFPEDLPGVQAAAGQMKAWLADRQGAIVGVDLGEAVRLEDRRSRSASGHDLAAQDGAPLGVQHRRHLRRREKGVDKTQFFFRYDYLDENRSGRRRPGRLVHRQDRRSRRRRSEMAREVRRDVRELVGRNQDHHREGIRRGLRQAGRRHRRDHDRDPRRRAVHDPAGRGQHDGAVGARADQRARRAEDARLLERADPGAGARRVAVRSRSSAAGSACSPAWLFVQRGDPTGGMLPMFDLPARDVVHRRRADASVLGLAAGLLPAMAGDAAEDHRRVEEGHERVLDRADHSPSRRSTSAPSRSASARRRWPSSASPASSSCSSRCCRSRRASARRCRRSGSPTRALVMRSGADSEMTSGLAGDRSRHHQAGAGHARDGERAARVAGAVRHHRPAASSRTRHRRQRADARHRAGGVPGAHEGHDRRRPRCFELGTNEVIVGRGATRSVRRPDRRVDREVRAEPPGRSSASSRRTAASPRPRSGATPRCCRALSARQLATSRCWRGSTRPTRSTRFSDWLTTNPQLNVQVRRETEYYAQQSQTLQPAHPGRSASASPRSWASARCSARS